LAVSEEVILKVKDQNDIVDIVSEVVRLKKSGRNYFGLCPFHHEDSPSFSVSQDKQIYKCFGCGEAGNVLTFVMKTKNFPFIDALKYLADRAHVDLELDNQGDKVKKDARERLFKINVEAAKFFFLNLSQNKTVKEYFLHRGITEATIRKFGLGFSLDSWNSLIYYLREKGYTELDLLSVGLIVKNQNDKYYDRFRNRVMFPVFDYSGRVIGFGGRVLDDSKPKYLNSPETTLFNKGINLYGLNFALKNLKERMFIIVEGYMDCISLHQYGITNVVASLGTALTINQAKLLKKYADKVIISYDADIAGQAATLRGLDILRKEGFDVRVLKVPQGKDPDEYIRSNGKEAFQRLINDAMPLIDYKIKRASEGIDFSNNEMIIKYASLITEILSDLNPVEKDVYIKKVSEETGIKEQAIYDLLSGEMQKNVNKLQEVNITGNFGQKLYLEPVYIKDERYLLKLMLKNGEAFKYILKNFNSEQFIIESHKKIYNLIIENIHIEEKEREKRIELRCDDIESSKEWVNVCEIELFTGEDFNVESLIQDYIRDLKKYKLEESKKEIMNKIKEYESKGLVQESINLLKELSKIQNEMRNL
jgi:DNA primase